MKRVVSEMMFTLLLIGMLALAFNIQPVKATGETIYIRADGNIEPSTAPIQRDEDLYTLTGNITSDAYGIMVERNNMTLDGAGYTLQGTGASGFKGIYLTGRSNITIKNIQVKTFYYGIQLFASSNNSIVGNDITDNDYGIYLDYSSNNRIVGNNITDNGDGIQPSVSSNNRIVGNNITDNDYNGIKILASSNNSIVGNNITNNSDGIGLSGSSNNSIVGNNITDNDYNGIIYFSPSSSNNSIVGNDITDNDYGIQLYYSPNNNSIVENNITNNNYGISLYLSSNNKFYHNNFIDNTQQVYFDYSSHANVWDDGYPSGGNYWSDHTGVDLYSGPYQNETGSDGIGDIPYTIYPNNTDGYPLTGSFTVFDAGTWNEVNYNVNIASNSTLSSFYFNPDEGAFIHFNVTESNGTTGFCRVAIPKQLLWVENRQWIVHVGNEPIVPTIAEDANHTYFYFTYSHSTKTIRITGTDAVPEFASAIILPLFTALTLLTVIFKRRKNR